MASCRDVGGAGGDWGIFGLPVYVCGDNGGGRGESMLRCASQFQGTLNHSFYGSTLYIMPSQ